MSNGSTPAVGASRTGACERCHRRKVRCTKTQPCSPCARANVPCRYTASDNQLRRQNVLRLEQQVKELRADNEALRRSSEGASVQGQRSRVLSPEVGNGGQGMAYATPSASHFDTNNSNAGLGHAVNGDGEVADQVVHLSLIAGGGHHFVGSTSGLLLANLLQSRPQPQSATGDSSGWQPNAVIDSNPSHSTSSLPPKPLAKELIAAYCSHDHLCYPFLSTKALHRSLDAVYDADNGKADPADAFVVDMTLAIGTAQVHKFNWNGMYDAETHYNRAMTRLVDVLARDGIVRVQALLLVCQYRMGTTSSNTQTSVWHLIGVAARTCLELGLHRASAYALPDGQDSSPAVSESAWAQKSEEMEIKRRCFWSMVALDRVTSLALGRPFAIQLDDIEVDLPVHEPSTSIPPQSSLSEAEYGTPHWHLATSIFAHIVRYRLICGKIMTSLHRYSKHASSVDHSAVRESLSQELQDWLVQTADLPLVPSQSAQPASPARVSSFRSEEWYRLLYHNGMLMLFRPSPCLNDATRNSAALQHIFDSSRESINLYATLHRSRRMNYSWITMHAVFMAGLSYIYALRNHFQALRTASSSSEGGPAEEHKATLQTNPSINQVVNDTRSCSKVLVAVSERWDLARTCSELFDRLSDAVVSDVVEARSAVPPTPGPVHHQMQSPGTLRNASTLGLAGATPVALQDDVYATSSGFVNMTVDSTLRDCYPDLQNLGYDQYHNDAIAQLSQDWFFGIGDPGGRYY